MTKINAMTREIKVGDKVAHCKFPSFQGAVINVFKNNHAETVVHIRGLDDEVYSELAKN